MNEMVKGTSLPRLDVEQIEAMFERDSLHLLGIASPPALQHSKGGLGTVDLERPAPNHSVT